VKNPSPTNKINYQVVLVCSVIS